MWVVQLALRRPYTFVVMAIFILIMGSLAIVRTPTDIFPNINIPVVSIIWNSSSPRFQSALCMLPLSGVARYLFVPLAEAVVFAMLASYLF
jgi:multidrug efflux pump subunit AcrB